MGVVFTAFASARSVVDNRGRTASRSKSRVAIKTEKRRLSAVKTLVAPRASPICGKTGVPRNDFQTVIEGKSRKNSSNFVANVFSIRGVDRALPRCPIKTSSAEPFLKCCSVTVRRTMSARTAKYPMMKRATAKKADRTNA